MLTITDIPHNIFFVVLFLFSCIISHTYIIPDDANKPQVCWLEKYAHMHLHIISPYSQITETHRKDHTEPVKEIQKWLICSALSICSVKDFLEKLKSCHGD